FPHCRRLSLKLQPWPRSVTMNCSVTLYTVRFRRKHLRNWTARLPRDIGATLISEAFTELLDGNAAAIKGLPFVSHCDGRKRRRTDGSIDPSPTPDPARVAAALTKYGW